MDNGTYRVLCFGHSGHFSGKKLFSAVSEDGIRFEPEAPSLDGTDHPHGIMTLPKGAEICFSDGALCSIAGDYVDVFNTEGIRYRRFGLLPTAGHK